MMRKVNYVGFYFRYSDRCMLCEDCHERARYFDHQLRIELGLECDAPVGVGDDVKQVEDFQLSKVRSAARALLKDLGKDKIPRPRAEELRKTVKDHYQVEGIDEQLLKRGADANTV